MCRLYGFRGLATPVFRGLYTASHALVKQSCRDSFGEVHQDGWGIGWYENTLPRIERGAAPAGEDARFAGTARSVCGRTVVAHVRAASVGSNSLENTHPFAYGRWLFAHNGTITAYDQVGPSLERETERELLGHRRGSTDSELVFYWLLGRFQRAGIDLEHSSPCGGLADLLGLAVLDLADRCVRAGAAESAGLNFLLTDGDVLLATRWGRSLSYFQEDEAVHIASEPPWSDSWQEAAKCSMLTVDDGLKVGVRDL